MPQSFWKWLEKHNDKSTVIAAALFTTQIVHLIWLTVNVVFPRLLGISPMVSSNFFNFLIAIVDYTEIPALIITVLVYGRSYWKKPNFKDGLYLLFLNIQWVHLFWITDEVVLQIFNAGGGAWNPLVAWVAILIDYLELPVMYETIRRAITVMEKRK